MFYRFALILFLTYNLTFSQLSVRNNYFIYVNDESVFVEDDINLNEANSMIYLRNEAQLIQGSGTTGNSGIGQLSVYQNGNVGEYEYNYWCSPVGNILANDNSNRPFRANNIIYDVTAAPITSSLATYTTSLNGASSPLVISSRWLWTFDPGTAYSEWDYIQETGDVATGYGFTMKGTAGSGDNQLYDFRGKPNKGTISANVLNGQFTLVGNPYPSALDAHAYIWDANNATTITGVLHYWEQDPSVDSHAIAAYNGGYATYTINAAATLETFISAVFNTYNIDGTINLSNTGTGSKTARRYIPIGQGFMVEGIANGNVNAENSHRAYVKETAANSEFFRNSNNSNPEFSIVPSDYKRFRLNIDFNNTYTRQLVETFHATATDGFDRGLETNIKAEDIIPSDAYWPNNNSSYLAEALSFDEAMTIPLTIQLAEDMPIRIRIADIQNFDESLPIYVHDKEDNLYVNLRTQDFNRNLETGIYTDRFEITFKENSLSFDDDIFEDFNVIQNNRRSTLKILNPNRLEVDYVTLFDVSGKQILNERIKKAKRQYTYSTKSFSDGVYIAKINLQNGQTFTKKVVIGNSN